MAIVEVKHTPIGTSSPSYGSLVAAMHQVLHELPGIAHQVTPTSTILEGDLETCMAAAQRMHRLGFQFGVPRMMTNIVIDERVDKPTSGEEMVREVEGTEGAARQWNPDFQAAPTGGFTWGIAQQVPEAGTHF